MITDLAVIPDLDHLDPDDERACLWTAVDMFPEDQDGRAAAKAVCTPCPVRAACETAARTIPGLLGVWGGTDEDDRDVLDLDLPDPVLYPRPCSGCGCRMRRKGTTRQPGVRVHIGRDLCSTCYTRARRNTST